MLKTIEFFENKGKVKFKSDYYEKVWYADFIEFLKKEKVFATLLTPSAYGGEVCRWDTYRNGHLNLKNERLNLGHCI
jgi:acyl-CoA dehydrogenase